MTITLKNLLLVLSDAARDANASLVRNYEAALQSETSTVCPPGPLRIASMKVTLSAHVTDAEQVESGDDLALSFGDKAANFTGELIFAPSEDQTFYTGGIDK